MPNSKSLGESNSSNFPFTHSPSKSTSILHGTNKISKNGSTEKVIFKIIYLVRVTGRVLHRNSCLVPHTSNGGEGFEYVVPLLVKEEADRSNPQGLIVSKGFIPYSMREPGLRYRVENARTQSFVGFVSQLDELKNTQFTQGNTTQQGKLKFTCADC